MRQGAIPPRAGCPGAGLAALESLREWDLGGGLRLTYGPANRTGLEFADLAIIDGEGHFRR